MADGDLQYVCDQIDRLMTVEFRVYGMHDDDSKPQTRGTIRSLYDAAVKKQGEPLTYAAATGIVSSVKPGDVVVITTGWAVPPAIPRGETDGTYGALALAKALSFGLNARVVFVSEEACHPVLRAGILALGLREYDVQFLLDNRAAGTAGGVAVIDFTMDAAKAPAEARALLDRLKPSAIIATEKAGRNHNGVYHTGLGNDFSAANIKIDHAIDEARKRGIFTVGIIDLGNEIGGGNIVETIREELPWGRTCNCPCGGGLATTVETDVVIPAAACNFGGYALAAALAAALDDLSIAHDVESERLLALECGRAGAIDGVTRTSGGFRILNGVKFEDYTPMIQLFRTIAQSKKIKYRINTLRS